MTTAGDVTEITVNHPTLGSFVFLPKANEGNTLDLGGFVNSDDQNMIDGAGGLIVQKNRVRASFEVVCADDMNTREDSSFAKDLAASPEVGEWTLTHVNGAVYGGNGVVVGDIQTDMNAGTFSLKVAFGKLTKIAG